MAFDLIHGRVRHENEQVAAVRPPHRPPQASRRLLPRASDRPEFRKVTQAGGEQMKFPPAMFETHQCDRSAVETQGATARATELAATRQMGRQGRGSTSRLARLAGWSETFSKVTPLSEIQGGTN